MKVPPLNTVVSKIAALGVPGLVLVVAMGLSGWAGAAALTAALATLGGPLGMLGGVALLGIMLMVSHALTEYGFEVVFSRVVDELHKKGVTTHEILLKIDAYPIGKDLKSRLRALLENRRPPKPLAKRKPKRPVKRESEPEFSEIQQHVRHQKRSGSRKK